jgi:predicted peptidase
MNVHKFLIAVKVLLLAAGLVVSPSVFAAGDTATIDSFKVAAYYTSTSSTDPFGRTVEAATIGYRLFVPNNYNPAIKYPIVLSLTGSGGVTDNRSQLKYRFNRMWADDSIQAAQPMFVLAPQSPGQNVPWIQFSSGSVPLIYSGSVINPGLGAVIQLYDSLLQTYSIDTNRQYVIGHSAGGWAMYYLLNRFPNRWAAAVPVAACGDTTRAVVNSWLNTRIWLHHGSADPSVNVNCSRLMFAALNRAYTAASKDTSGRMRYSEYAGGDHYSNENASRDDRLMPWVLGWGVPVAIYTRPPRRSPEGGTRSAPVPTFDAMGRPQNPEWAPFPVFFKPADR